ncbi:MAG: hypothetical protein L3J39_14560 [Verrucomicrobiales bacterium]|nr:hypothetical protein [Verrucomicrobiales bacterium]
MRPPLNKQRLLRFLKEFGSSIPGKGNIYLTGGATALLHDWREMTVDVDIKADPEPQGFFETIAQLKDSFPINIELASPDLFIPPLPDWKQRSIFIAQHGNIDFYHYDLYSQALAKLERAHPRDLDDVENMHDHHLIKSPLLLDLFTQIEDDLKKYPTIEASALRTTIHQWCEQHPA